MEERDDIHFEHQVSLELVVQVIIHCQAAETYNEHVTEFIGTDDCANWVKMCVNGIFKGMDGILVQIGRPHDNQ